MARFVFLTVVVAWVLWIPAMLWLRSVGRLGGTEEESPLEGLPAWIGILWFLGASSPSLVAVGLTGIDSGSAFVTELLGRLLDWDVGLSWNVIAWFGPLALGLVAVAAHVAGGGAGVRPQPKRIPLALVSLIAALPFGPLGEELGWRGYFLDELLTTRGAAASAIIVGFVWTFWHLPVFWAPLGTTISGKRVTIRRVAGYWLEVTAVSVIMTWLFVETAGSLWIAVGFHAAWNAAQHRFFFEPFSDETADRVEFLYAVLMTVGAVLLLVWPDLAWRSR